MKLKSTQGFGWLFPAAVLVAAILIILLTQSTRIIIPEGDILFSVHDDEKQQWGFLTLQDRTIEYLTPIDLGWEFPTLTSDLRNILFRRNSFSIFPPSRDYLGFDVGIWGDLAREARYCENAGWPGRPRWVSNYNQVILAKNNPSEIVFFDPVKCEVTQVLYQFSQETVDRVSSIQTSEVYIHNPDISHQGLLAFSVIPQCCDPNSSPGSVMIVDVSTSQITRVINDATDAAWSPDGSRLAYVGLDGIYLIDLSNNETTKVVDYEAALKEEEKDGVRWEWAPWLSFPEWSPDGENIVYHRVVEAKPPEQWSVYNVYMYGLDTREETLLVENAMNPIWISR